MESTIHLMGRTKDRQSFNQSLTQRWQLEQSRLHQLFLHKKIELHAYILMPNHFHLLGKIHGVLSGQEFDTNLDYNFEIINHWKAYCDTYRYIYLNPVRAQLCREPHHYPYSTLHTQYYRKPFLCPVRPKISNGLGGIEGEVYWIAHSPFFLAAQNKQKNIGKI